MMIYTLEREKSFQKFFLSLEYFSRSDWNFRKRMMDTQTFKNVSKGETSENASLLVWTGLDAVIFAKFSAKLVVDTLLILYGWKNYNCFSHWCCSTRYYVSFSSSTQSVIFPEICLETCSDIQSHMQVPLKRVWLDNNLCKLSVCNVSISGNPGTTLWISAI